MSLRSRRRRRFSRTLNRLRRDLKRHLARMDRCAGDRMNLPWLAAAADASTCLDRLERLGRPISTAPPKGYCDAGEFELIEVRG